MWVGLVYFLVRIGLISSKEIENPRESKRRKSEKAKGKQKVDYPALEETEREAGRVDQGTDDKETIPVVLEEDPGLLWFNKQCK